MFFAGKGAGVESVSAMATPPVGAMFFVVGSQLLRSDFEEEE
jgi:hypothetical protein